MGGAAPREGTRAGTTNDRARARGWPPERPSPPSGTEAWPRWSLVLAQHADPAPSEHTHFENDKCSIYIPQITVIQKSAITF